MSNELTFLENISEAHLCEFSYLLENSLPGYGEGGTGTTPTLCMWSALKGQKLELKAERERMKLNESQVIGGATERQAGKPTN